MRALWFWEFAQNGAAPVVQLETERERAQLRIRLLPALNTARDWKLAGMFTGAAPDCGPQPGETTLTLGWCILAAKPNGRGGGRQGHTETGLLTNKR